MPRVISPFLFPGLFRVKSTQLTEAEGETQATWLFQAYSAHWFYQFLLPNVMDMADQTNLTMAHLLFLSSPLFHFRFGGGVPLDTTIYKNLSAVTPQTAIVRIAVIPVSWIVQVAAMAAIDAAVATAIVAFAAGTVANSNLNIIDK